jgi:hypothetical protein
MADQSLKNHTRIVPIYHMGVFFPLLLNFLWSIYRVAQEPTGDRVIGLIVAVALLLMFLSVRQQVLTVQDRVIRLEMRLRMRELLPADVYARAAALPLKQLIALRFAGDAELPGLVRDVLAGTVTTQKDIKTRIKDWQADFLRA